MIMRMANAILCLASRGKRRRNAIVEMLSRHPGREYTETEIARCMGSWIGLINSDMQTLVKSEHVARRTDEKDRAYYQIPLATETEGAT